MLTTGRIASVDRWCDWHKLPATRSSKAREIAEHMVGVEVQIETNSLRESPCVKGARLWTITQESLDRLDRIAKYIDGTAALCEHILEMD